MVGGAVVGGAVVGAEVGAFVDGASATAAAAAADKRHELGELRPAWLKTTSYTVLRSQLARSKEKSRYWNTAGCGRWYCCGASTGSWFEWPCCEHGWLSTTCSDGVPAG